KMSQEKTAVRLDRRQLNLIFHGELEDIAVPVEIRAPDLLRQGFDTVPSLSTELGLVPRSRREARNAIIDPSHFLRRSQAFHACKSQPRPFEAARAAID